MTMQFTPEEAADRLALRALADEYAWRTDHYDYDGYADLFVEDGEVTAVNHGETEPFFRARGREELKGVVHGNDQFERTFHAVENHRCQLDGDRATGVTYCTAHHLMSNNGRPRTLVMLIRYHDAYSRTDSGWKFQSRQLAFAWVEYVETDTSPYPFSQGTDDWMEETSKVA
jgi:hypothetical protein